MRKQTLGATGIEVSELSLGTWGLSGDGYGPAPVEQAKSVMERARAMGITLFETSQSYGRGTTETELGATVAQDKEVTIVTKWGTDRSASVTRKRFDVDYLKQSLESSKERLGKDARIIALLHNPSETALKDGSALGTLKEMHEQGDLVSYGVSVGNEAVARAALEASAPVLSFAYNALVVQPLRSMMSLLEEKNTGVLVHSVLFYGLLTGQWSMNRTFRSTDHRSERWPEGTLATRVRHLDALRPMISGEVTSMRSAALRFVLENPRVHSAILGPRMSGQLDQMVRDVQGERPLLSPAKLTAFEARLQQLEVPR